MRRLRASHKHLSRLLLNHGEHSTHCVECQVAATSDSIPVGGQLQQRVDIRIEQPFATSPTLDVHFVVGGASASLRISIPIITAKFVAGYTLSDPKQFAGVWAQVCRSSPAAVGFFSIAESMHAGCC